MDLSLGYWQLGVHPDDQNKTAFVTADGLYNFKLLPYGFCNSGAHLNAHGTKLGGVTLVNLFDLC